MLKKILGMAALCVAISATAFAKTNVMIEKGDKYQFIYPQFEFASEEASKVANADIAEVVASIREDVSDPTYLDLNTNFSVIREDEKYVNIIFIRGVYTGGAHGMYYASGFVFDKATGYRVPYDSFVPTVETKELLEGIKSGKNIVYTTDMKTVSSLSLLNDAYFKLHENYILADDGYLYMMFQPYELDTYAAGITYVRLGKY